AHDGQIGERTDLETIVCENLGHMGTAGPARLAVDGHCARAAHAYAAGKAIGERRVELALDPCHHIEHGLRILARHEVVPVSPVSAAAPDGNVEIRLF